jgi:hypothetical protein
LRYGISCEHHHGAVSKIYLSILATCLANVQIGANRYSCIGIRSKRIGNAFRIPHIKIDQAVHEIWLVVDLSLSQHINRDADPKDACVLENR